MANISDIVNSKTNQVELQANSTNWVDNSVVSIGLAGTVNSARFRCIKDNLNKYVLEYHINMTASVSTVTHIIPLGLGGVTFNKREAGSQSGEVSGRSYCISGTANLASQSGYGGTGVSSVNIEISGSGELSGKPTWFDDNLMTSSGLPVATADTYGVVRAPNSEIKVVDGTPGHGSTNTTIREFATLEINTGTAITHATSTANGDTFTINEDGIYSMSYTDGGAISEVGISLNSTQLTSSITAITAADRIAFVTATSATGNGANVNITRRLSAGDVIRCHTDGFPTSGTLAYFTIVQVVAL